MPATLSSIQLGLRELEQPLHLSLPSRAMLALSTPLWVSGVVMAVLAVMLKLSLYGFHTNFASQFVTDWFVMWVLAIPFSYVIASFIRTRKAESSAAS